MRKAIRKHRGERTAIVARIPAVMVDRIDEERAKYGATRVDYVWSVLAHHFEMDDLDPLVDSPVDAETEQLLLDSRPHGSPSPTRAA